MTLRKLGSRLKHIDRLKLSFSRSAQIQSALSSLSTNGYYKIENFLSPSMLSAVQAALEQSLQIGNFEMPCLSQTLVDPQKHKKLIDSFFLGGPKDYLRQGVAFDRAQFSSLDQVLRDFSPSTIKVNLDDQTIAFAKILLDDFILDLCESYFGLKPYLVEAYARRNFPAKYRVMNHMWHRDSNHKFFLLKAFVFLSDCSLTNGPHQFVTGSHRTSLFTNKTYYEDAEIEQAFGPQISTSVVKAGTLIIEDTRGLHRACVPQEGQRDLLYGVYLPLPFWLDKKYHHYEVSRQTAAASLSPRQLSYLTW